METPLLFFCLIHRDFFETLERYKPRPELLRLTGQICPENWQIIPGGFWTVCTPPSHVMESQGWKIHISGTRSTAPTLLSRLVPLLVAEAVPFKFCSDLNMVELSTSKNWHRTAAGKFMTIYPDTAERFTSLAERCYELTRDLAGPYILTDRPFKDSRVVFYRYGGHRLSFRMGAQGRRIPLIKSPLGEDLPDERKPMRYMPDWEKDPFGASTRNTPSPSLLAGREISLRNGRYKVDGALRYSSVGGIYTAIDTQTGQEVIIREARPHLSYSVEVLHKEARILQRLAPTGLAPRFVELFQEWEHYFLAEERIRAESLWSYAMSFVLGKEAMGDSQDLFRRLRDTICKLAQGLQEVHDRGIILRDLTKTNVLFTLEPGEESVKFIDFEFAYEKDRNEPVVPGFTTGYASPQQRSDELPQLADDYYALGALILDSVAFTAAGLDLNRAGILLALRQTIDDLGLPQILAELVENLTDPKPEIRDCPEQVQRKLLAIESSQFAVPRDCLMFPGRQDFTAGTATENLDEELHATLDGITGYILQHADYTRDDRLWPASPQVFFTSPVGLRYGAAGIAYYLLRVTGEVPSHAMNWILQHSDPATSPSGMYNGLAGVALFLLHAGWVDESIRVLKLARDEARITELPGLYDGAAGWGLTNLHFWHITKEYIYLDEADRIGEYLLQSAKRFNGAVFWESGPKTPVGLGYGASGIGLFFLYLYLAQRNPRHLDIARQAVTSEISAGVWLGERVYHHDFRDVPSTAPKSPHMSHGSGGVGAAAMRLYAITGEESFRAFAQSCADTVSSRYTNKLWQDWGLAGFGELLLDSFRFLKNKRHLQNAYYIAEGLLPYRIHRDSGIAFPGSELIKISCDFGLGSAGIGMFLHRLLHRGISRILFLDELIDGGMETESKTEACGGVSVSGSAGS